MRLFGLQPHQYPGTGGEGTGHHPQYLGVGAEVQHCCHPSWDLPSPRQRAVLGYTGYLPQCPWGCRRPGSPTVERFPKSASSAVFAASSVISAPCYKCHLKPCPGGKSPLVSLPDMVVSPSCPHPAAQPVASSHRGFQQTEAQKAPSGRGVPGVAWPAAILPHLSVSAERRANPHGQRQQGQRHVPPLH